MPDGTGLATPPSAPASPRSSSKSEPPRDSLADVAGECSRSAQPFTDPSVRPLTMYFCAMSANSSIGTIATTEAAAISPHLIAA